jgi:hypothetical protein
MIGIGEHNLVGMEWRAVIFMLKICAATSYTRDFEKVGNFSALTLKTYTQKFGYDLRINSDLVVTDRGASWQKIPLIRELFHEGYDFVFWMDADAIFMRYDQDLQEVIEPGKDLYMVNHPIPDPFLGQMDTPNAGVLLLRNCEWTQNLLQDLWDFEEYIRHPWWENAALLDLMGYYSPLEKGENQLNQEFLEHVKFIGLEWNSFPPPHSAICCASRPIIKHYATFPNEIRIRRMSRDYLFATCFLPEKEKLAGLFSRAGNLLPRSSR